tara:strand:- start:44 stop:220 length:177 start_codon:yes stop_codon:yes gene_type:complete
MSIKKVKKLNDLRTNELGGYEMTTNDDKVWSVPLDENNTDYQAILAWVAEGNTIEEAD